MRCPHFTLITHHYLVTTACILTTAHPVSMPPRANLADFAQRATVTGLVGMSVRDGLKLREGVCSVALTTVSLSRP